MAFCEQCGEQLDEDAKFCSECGSPVNQDRKEGQKKLDSSEVIFDHIDNTTTDVKVQFEKSEVQQGKIMAILSYLGFLALIPILAGKSGYVRFHANQGLILLICEAVYRVAYKILSKAAYGLFWPLGVLVSLFNVISLVFLVLTIIGVVNALNGEAKELPVIGGFRILK